MNDLFGKPIFGEPEKPLSPTRRRTIRARARIANGRHPFGAPLLSPNPDKKTCGDCDFMFGKRQSGTWYKCKKYGNTSGPGTDLRLGWPACKFFKLRREGS